MAGLLTTRYAEHCCVAIYFSAQEVTTVASYFSLSVNNDHFSASFLLQPVLQLEIPVQIMLLGDIPLLLDR
jgi:hypothetical protein